MVAAIAKSKIASVKDVVIGRKMMMMVHSSCSRTSARTSSGRSSTVYDIARTVYPPNGLPRYPLVWAPQRLKNEAISAYDLLQTTPPMWQVFRPKPYIICEPQSRSGKVSKMSSLRY